MWAQRHWPALTISLCLRGGTVRYEDGAGNTVEENSTLASSP